MAEKVGEIFYEVSMDAAPAINEGRRFRRDLNETEKSLDQLNAKATAVSKAVQSFVAGLAIAATIRKIVQETRNAEQEQAQLAAVLISTGESAGWSAERLNAMADALAKVSTFSAGEITQAQTRLLSYTNIVGEQVPQAMQATIDMAARLGMNLNQSAETIGRALDKPSEGMQTLRRQGFKFGEDQIAMAKKLESTGKVAQAQALVLSELTVAYGGAAAAARDTFGGALTALQNQLNDLLTADGASLGGATKAVNELTNTLGSSETKAAFDAITGWVVGLARVLVTATTNIVAFINSSDKLKQLTGTDAFGKMKSDAKATSAEIDRLIGMEERYQAAIERGDNVGRNTRNRDRIRTKIQDLQRLSLQQAEAMKALADGPNEGEIAGPPVSAMNKPSAPDASGAKAREEAEKKAARKAEQERERQRTQAKEYLKNLDDQLVKTQGLTTYEQLMYDVKKGNVHLSDQQLAKAQGLATAIDMVKDLEEKRVIASNQLNAELSAQRDLLAQIDNYSQNIAGMTMSDRAVQDMQARVQITETYLSRIRDLEAQERQALATNQDSSKEASIRKQYADLIAVQQEYQTKSLAEWEKYVLARNAKEGDWTTGAQKAYANYVESARNASAQAQSLFEKGFQTMEDAAVSMAMNTKVSFSDMARSIIADIIRIQIRAAATGGSGGGGLLGSLFSAGMSLLGGGTPVGAAGNAGYGDYTGAGLAAAFGGKRENGGDVSAGRMYEVNERGEPELLKVGNKQMLMMAGQSGTVTPLGDGRMNVANVPAPSSPNVELNVRIIGAPSEPTVQRSRNASGGLDVEVIFKQFDNRFAEGISGGSSSSYRAFKNRFGLRD